MARVQRALISVFDKTGLAPFAQALAKAGVEIISTGGTAKALREAGLKVTDLSAHTGFPEMLDGRVKTLHPKIHGGLLYVRENAAHREQVKAHGIQPIDLVAVNLYPFEQTVAKPNVTREEAIENIDIGGPSMLRSAAKNHESVTVIVDPADYAEVAAQIEKTGNTTVELRRTLAAKAFARTSAYDGAIALYFSEHAVAPPVERPVRAPGLQGRAVAAAGGGSDGAELRSTGPAEAGTTNLSLPLVQSLRYGENSHQAAALYGKFGDYFEQLHGKELSYNNILDLTAAAYLVAEFGDAEPATLAILKHTNPCGVGQGSTLREAWEKAYATDKQAPFGGIIAVNRALDPACAEAIAETFSEVIVAPDFAPEALVTLQKKKNLRLMKLRKNVQSADPREWRSVGADSVVLQQRDTRAVRREEMKVVSRRQPTDAEWQAMLFGWRVVKHVKSNAIVYAGPDRTLGIGAGQMSRVDSSRIAVWKAGEAGLSLKGSAVCSDAFFSVSGWFDCRRSGRCDCRNPARWIRARS